MRGIKTAAVTIAMVATILMVPSTASTAAVTPPIEPDVIGTEQTTAAGSCWEIKQLRPGAASGPYWLLTPRMSEPQQFYCDMTTDGGGWVLVGKGRNQWTYEHTGKNPDEVLTPNPAAQGPQRSAQLHGDTIMDLLNGGRVDALAEGIRLRRATNAAGTTWQEARFKFAKRDRWSWAFGADHSLGSWSFDSVTGSGGLTSNFGSNNTFNRVTTIPQSNQSYAKAFAFGSAARGTTAAGSYLFSQATNRGYPQPFTQMYIRPRVLSTDAGFTEIPPAGLPKYEQPAIAESLATPTNWSVTGLKGSVSREGSVEVQAFTESLDKSTMYVGGNFRYVQEVNRSSNTKVQQVEQSFLAAFDRVTGEWKRDFRPVLNEQVKALTTLPGGQILAGGQFTQANGEARMLVALDPVTGATDRNFSINARNTVSGGVGRIEVLKVHDGKVYVGGQLTHLRGGPGDNEQGANMLGRFDAATGTPDPTWNPQINFTVIDTAVAIDGSQIFAGGFFDRVAGVKQESGTAVSTAAGAALMSGSKNWTAEWSNSRATYQQAVETSPGRAWFGGSEHSLFQYRDTDYVRTMGDITLKGGDFQAAKLSTDDAVVYAGCHCNNYSYHDAYAWPDPGRNFAQADSMDYAGAWDAVTGDRRPEWTPRFKSRLDSGTWAMESDSDNTLWVGGDFTHVATNAREAQIAGGFARFPQVDTSAPNPVRDLDISNDAGKEVTLTWKKNGNPNGVRYQVLRDDRPIASTAAGADSITVPKGGGAERFFVRAVDQAGNYSATGQGKQASPARFGPRARFDHSVRNATVTLDASPSSSDFDRPISAYAWDFGDGTTSTSNKKIVDHTYSNARSYSVTLTITDSSGESSTITQTVVAGQPAAPSPSDAYGRAIYKQDPYVFYRLDEASGTRAADSGRDNRHGTWGGAKWTRNQAPALATNPAGKSARQEKSGGIFGIGAAGSAYVSSPERIAGPEEFTIGVWFQGTTSRGGRLIGFSDNQTGDSSSYDRHLQLQSNGQVMFGVYDGAEQRVTSPATYRDGNWHYAVGTLSTSEGMKLYVDGQLVGTNPSATRAQAFSGYWKVGTDKTWSGTSQNYFEGWFDEAVVFHRPLSTAEVAAQWTVANGGSVPVENIAPTAAFSVATTADLGVVVDASESVDPDGTIVSYAWDFGDGANESGQVASHTYTVAGTYDITLTVTDDEGATDTTTTTVTVVEGSDPGGDPNDLPTARFTHLVDGLKVSFDGSASSDPDGTVVSYDWDFGESGATGAGKTATHTYATHGSYTVTLTVTDNRGGTNTTTQRVSISDPNGPVVRDVIADGSTWRWRYETAAPNAAWNTDGFNDSSWATGAAVLGWGDPSVVTRVDTKFATPQDRPLAAYFRQSFDIADTTEVTDLTLRTVADDGVIVYVNGVEVGRKNMTDDNGDRNGHNVYAVAPPPRTTAAEADPLVITVPKGLLVNGSNTVAAETHINYRSTPDMTFHLKATLTTDPDAVSNNIAPTARFDHTADGQTLTFDGSASTDPDGEIIGYEWDFGDGTTGAGKTATHAYDAPGAYTVRLTVSDDMGETNTATKQVTVQAGPVTREVIAKDDSWRWWYRTAAPATDWNQIGFDASGWDQGRAVLGWGDGSVTTNIDTFANANDRPRVAYFTKTFEVENKGHVTQLTLDTVGDDGVVVYVNGVEVGRKNMDDRVPTHTTFAVAPPPRTAAANADPLTIEVPLNLLVEGTNTVSAQTHLNYRATPDLTFHLTAVMTSDASQATDNQTPTAAFAAAVDGMTVSFDGSGSTDPDGMVMDHAWEFGDGATATGATTQHTYGAAGTYQVSLTVTDDQGATHTTTKDVVVSAGVDKNVVVADDANWRWYYKTDAPAADWWNNGFDDSSWELGEAVLGWGHPSVKTIIDTEFATASQRPLTAYYRNTFEVDNTNDVVRLVLDTVADDGVIIFVNGVEVGRKNMADREPGHNVYAVAPPPRTAAANADPLVIDVPMNLLVNGTNTIAAETHINYRATPDMTFQLSATLFTASP